VYVLKVLRYLVRDLKSQRFQIHHADVLKIGFAHNFPNLEFLHIDTNFLSGCKWLSIEIILHLPRIKIVIPSRHVWELRRSANGFVQPLVWPAWRHQFYSLLDLPNDNLAWLMGTCIYTFLTLFSFFL
jgi:hypothetical protein